MRGEARDGWSCAEGSDPLGVSFGPGVFGRFSFPLGKKSRVLRMRPVVDWLYIRNFAELPLPGPQPLGRSFGRFTRPLREMRWVGRWTAGRSTESSVWADRRGCVTIKPDVDIPQNRCPESGFSPLPLPAIPAATGTFCRLYWAFAQVKRLGIPVAVFQESNRATASSPSSGEPDEMTPCPPAKGSPACERSHPNSPAKTTSASSADASRSARLRAAARSAASRLSPRARDSLRGTARGEAIKSCTDRLRLILKTFRDRHRHLKENLGLDDPRSLVRCACYPGRADDFRPILPLNTP